MPTAEQFTMDFCDRWIAKAYDYNDADLYGAFDRYFTLYVCFNRLYDQIAETAGRTETDDSKLATSVFAEVVGRDMIWVMLGTPDGQQDLEALASLIGPGGTFSIHHKRRTRRPDPLRRGSQPDLERDAKLKTDLTSPLPTTRVDAALTLLYKVRCNIIHGHKAVDLEQLRLLHPCIQSLRRVIAAGRSWLANAA